MEAPSRGGGEPFLSQRTPRPHRGSRRRRPRPAGRGGRGCRRRLWRACRRARPIGRPVTCCHPCWAASVPTTSPRHSTQPSHSHTCDSPHGPPEPGARHHRASACPAGLQAARPPAPTPCYCPPPASPPVSHHHHHHTHTHVHTHVHTHICGRTCEEHTPARAAERLAPPGPTMRRRRSMLYRRQGSPRSRLPTGDDTCVAVAACLPCTTYSTRTCRPARGIAPPSGPRHGSAAAAAAAPSQSRPRQCGHAGVSTRARHRGSVARARVCCAVRARVRVCLLAVKMKPCCTSNDASAGGASREQLTPISHDMGAQSLCRPVMPIKLANAHAHDHLADDRLLGHHPVKGMNYAIFARLELVSAPARKDLGPVPCTCVDRWLH